jgi:hypothetical protein
MNLHHAAALALVGWYLMVPPNVRDPSASAASIEPLDQWLNVRSFDTATACEDARTAMIGSYREELRKNTNSEHSFIGFSASSATECIASDDPRLKKK